MSQVKCKSNDANKMNNYYTHPALSQSKLKDLKRSPKHFWANHLSPNRTPMADTEAMRFGRAIHTCFFEPQEFQNTYVVAPKVDRRTSLGKTMYNDFILQNANKTVISEDDLILIKNIKESILSKTTAKILLNDGALTNGLPEQELYWVDADTGIECKAKLDFLIEPCEQFPNGLIIDLKTTNNATDVEFAKSVYTFGYYNQVAFYCNAVKTIYKTQDYPPFIFIPVEKSAPYECTFFASDEMMLKIGLQENTKLLNLYKSCLESNNWAGYEDKIQTIGLPSWVVNKFDLS